MDMVDSIKLKVYELVRAYADSYLFNIKKVKLTPEADLNTDLDIDELEVEDLMNNFFEKFNVARGDFKLETYYPHMLLWWNLFKKKIIDVPDFTLGMLRPVSKEEALKRWDYYGKIGSWKNENFRPLLFPDPEMFPNARPRKGELPNFMKTVSPWSDFRSGIVSIASADGSYIDKAKGGILPYA